jgi:formate hydrogenlyase subunit 3/multisubunit Na+/H+ antiporter MnhD subunit
MNLLLLASVLLPALLAFAAISRRGRAVAVRLAPWSAAPALLVSLLPPADAALHLSWVLTGSSWGLDATGRIFLFFTSSLWLAAGIHARTYLRDDPRRARYFVFHLLALTGNLGLIAALDVVTFYLFFSLMSFAAYGLVVHTGGEEARRAGRVYLAMAVLGESLLLAGILMATAGATGTLLPEVAVAVQHSPHSNIIIALLLAGFGIKAGALPLHVWLPLAHPVAPTPASAVLSGSMIKAGLLGWLRLLPLGAATLPGWGALLAALGLMAAFFGVVVGVTQRNAKTALAYSSISQMGIVNVGIGLALIEPAAWPIALAALLVYAVHHGLAKGALFLGVAVALEAGGPRSRWLLRAGMVFAALAVAGAPLTSGSVAKGALKEVAYLSPGVWPLALDWLLPLTTVGTTILMAHFLSLTWSSAKPEARPRAGLWAPWSGLLFLLLGVLYLLPRLYDLEIPGAQAPGLRYLVAGMWPIALGAGVWWFQRAVRQRFSWSVERWEIPAGDLLVFVEERVGAVGRALSREPEIPRREPIVELASRWYGVYAESGRDDRAWRLEVGLTRWPNAGVLTLLLVMLLAGLLAWGRGGFG